MADKNLTVFKTAKPCEPVDVTFTSVAAADTVLIPCEFKDEHTQLWFLGGSGAATITLQAGNGYNGVNDETFEVGAGAYKAVTINSDRFKHISGDYKGNMVAKASAACSIAVVEARV